MNAGVDEATTRRVVVVTGASGGIGSAMVERFTADGDIAVGLDLADGFDVTDPDQCAAAADRIVAEHGRIDVLCNNAGISAIGDVVQSTPDDWQRVFAVNVFGVANMSRAVLPHMRRAGSGVIVNTCSIVATVGLVQRAVYGASKGAVQALTRAMAADEVHHGIRVNCVSPGTVESPWVQRLVAATDDPDATYAALRKRQPMGALVTCETVADAVAYLAAPTTFTTGIDLLVDGGISGIRIVDAT
jgi:NAD(P)-dependent dehydrogenase (short-subunit alcohol dehydrogenase family)